MAGRASAGRASVVPGYGSRAAFNLEDVPLSTFLHHLLAAWRPADTSCATCQWPGPRTSPGFESWPESYQPPAAVGRMDFAIHSRVQGREADGPDDVRAARVTVKVSGTPWNELFENVLASNGLGFVVHKNLLFIARTEDLAAFDRIRGRKYNGFPITLNLLHGDLQDVFRLFADITGFEIVPDEDLPGSFTTVVAEHPALEVFDLLLAASDLAATSIAAPDGNPPATALRIRRLAAVRGDAVDASQLQPARGRTDPAPGVFSPTPARFVSLEGTVQVKKPGTHEWIPARRDMQLNQGDLVRSGPGASAEIRFADGFSFRLKPESLVTIEGKRPL